MNLAITARIRMLLDRYRVRIAIGVLFSLLVHGFILSMQLGIPGLGLPGLALPWSERRAQTPELSIRIANPAGSSTVLPQARPPNALPQPGSDQPLTELPNARIKQAPLRFAPNSERAAKALKSTPATVQAVRKNGTPPPDDQSTLAPARSQQELIALTGDKPSSFMVPAPNLDEWWHTSPMIASTPAPVHPPEQTAPPAIAMHTLKQSLEQATEPVPAVEKPSAQESFERPDEVRAQEPIPAKTPNVTVELAARKQGEEIARQEAARKLEEQEAAQLAQDIEARTREETLRLEAEKTASRLAAQKLEDAKKQELAAAALQAKELEARRQAEEITRRQTAVAALQKQLEAVQKQAEKQAEEAKMQEQAKAERQAMEFAMQKQAEEITRQKAAALERQKQEEQLAAQQKAQDLAARQKADAEAAAQRENARLAAAAAAASSRRDTGGGDGSSGTGTRSKDLGTGNLASKALEQIGKMGLIGIDSPLAIDADRSEENSRRRSIFGVVDHDIGLALYITGWRTKIERNGSLNYAQSSKDKAREDPVVTVAIRSDGSVENIVVNRSSGRADLDEAVQRIVRINAPYSVFPPSLARKYPVIEIRRVWNFDERIRILEEVR